MDQPNDNITKPVFLDSIPLERLLIDANLVNELATLGLEASSDIWVLALSEKISVHNEFSQLLQRISKVLAERNDIVKPKPYNIKFESFSQLVLSNLNEQLHSTEHEHLQEYSTYKVTLSILVNQHTSVYWQALISGYVLSQIMISDESVESLCERIFNAVKSKNISIGHWSQPHLDSWYSLLPVPTIDTVLKFIHFTKYTQRDLDMFQRRLGLRSGQRETLEETGQHFKITRERVRQIVERFRKSLIHPARRKQLNLFGAYLEKIFQEHGGIMTLEEVNDSVDFIDDFKDLSRITTLELILYFCGRFKALDYDYFSGRGGSEITDVIWHLKTIEPDDINSTRVIADKIVNEDPTKYSFDDLVELLSSISTLSEDAIRASLRTYQLIKEDSWGYMVPSKLGIDIRLTITSIAVIALRDIGVPAHYTTITNRINELYPDRDLKPNHVHNHLSNPLFRWVDRGTYGLAEWGLPEIRPKENYALGRKLVIAALQEIGRPASVKEIEYHVEVIRMKTRSQPLLSRVFIILGNSPNTFLSLGFGKWGLLEWNLAPVLAKNTVQLICQILSEDETAWLTIQQLYMQMKSRGWRKHLIAVQRALDREASKPSRKIRREELHGFGIQLYGLSSREWNEENVLNVLLAN